MKDFLYRFFHNKLAVSGSIILLLFVLMAAFAPVLAPYDPFYMDPAAAYRAFPGASPRDGQHGA